MANLLDIIVDTFPANNDVGVPLLTTVQILFNEAMDEDQLTEHFVLTGPDTDQFIGPGLSMLLNPDNISQGELDDFLRSPGYPGIVSGELTFEKVDVSDPDVLVSGVPYRTRLTFTPSQPLAALTEYKFLISQSDTISGVTYSGIYSLTFESGTGSIEEIPASVSSSVLTSTMLPVALQTAGAMTVKRTTPLDHAIEQAINLSSIVVEFTKDIDETSVTSDMITILAEPASDHPNTVATAQGYLAKTVTVSGNKLTISI
jgi:hypothetical protein